MKQPEFLKKGDKITRIAPSFGITTEPYITRFKHALSTFRSLGFKVFLGENIYKSEGRVASAFPKERADEFIRGYLDNSSLLLSVGGGERERDRLPFIDFEKIKEAKPKWFRGSSDNTNLCFTLTTIAGVRSIYSSNAPSFFAYPLSYTEKDALSRLEGKTSFRGYDYFSPPFESDNPLEPLHLTEKKTITPVNYKRPVTGTRIGGCLDCLLSLCGTKFDKRRAFSEKNKGGLIFYLESCDLNPLQIYRGLVQLREAGWFDHVNLFLIGRPLCQKREILGVDNKKAVLSALCPLNKPILFDIDLGHIPPALPFKNGGKATVSLTEDRNISIQYQA